MKIDLNISQKQAVNLLRFLYPLWALVGLFSIAYIPSKFIVSGDAIVTANNIIANGLLFRLGIAGNLLTHLIHIIVVLILYQLFKSVDKKQAMLIVILGLIGVPIAMFNEVFKAAALLLINNPESSTKIEKPENSVPEIISRDCLTLDLEIIPISSVCGSMKSGGVPLINNC